MTDSASGTDVAYYALADANKNITEYFDTNGNVVAHYEYSPFGKITQTSGLMSSDFDYRFSSEVFDTETGLIYYNYRYYSPELGRWLSRDPIEEGGGDNLYGMVGNNPINKWDALGYLKVSLKDILSSLSNLTKTEKKIWTSTNCGSKDKEISFSVTINANITIGKTIYPAGGSVNASTTMTIKITVPPYKKMDVYIYAQMELNPPTLTSPLSSLTSLYSFWR
jgi:RHS repeat-associated protein